MAFESLTAAAYWFITGPLALLADPEFPAPIIFPSFFLFLFFIPSHLILMGLRSLFVDFKGWLMPRQARKLEAKLNMISTLGLAGFLPGWISTLVVWYWYPEFTPSDGVRIGFAFAIGYSLAYWLLLVRGSPGLADALGRGYWSSVPIGGFFLCYYIGAFLYSGEAVLLSFTFLFAPLGATLILPFTAGTPPSIADDAPSCLLCSEAIEVAPVHCSHCKASYHAECWEHREGCGRKDCRSEGTSQTAHG